LLLRLLQKQSVVVEAERETLQQQAEKMLQVYLKQFP